MRVTNQSDKDTHLPKILLLSQEVQKAFREPAAAGPVVIAPVVAAAPAAGAPSAADDAAPAPAAASARRHVPRLLALGSTKGLLSHLRGAPASQREVPPAILESEGLAKPPVGTIQRV